MRHRPTTNAVNESRATNGSIELGKLIDGVVADKRLADKEHKVGVVHANELGERLHQWFIVLHAASSINYNTMRDQNPRHE